MMKSISTAALLIASGVNGDSECPGSKAWITHAKTKLGVEFSNSCSDVSKIIVNRANGSQNGGWTDPHNKGVYTVDSSSASKLEIHRTTGDGGCDVVACSESQVTSVKDFSTNYCNLHDLYCSDDGCNGGSDLKYTETVNECSSGQHSQSDCYKVSAPENVLFAAQEDTTTLYEIKDGECGQTALNSKYVKYAEKFDSGLKEGDCVSQGYTVPDGSESHSVPFLGTITVKKFKKPSLVSLNFESDSTSTLYEIKDGECGQTTLDSKYVKYAEKFDSELKEGDCASQGYTVPDGKVSHSVPFLGTITVEKFKKSSSMKLRGNKNDESCKPVTTQDNFDFDSYISKRWYIQQQMPTKYLPASQNYCVYAEYTKMEKKNFWGYSVQVHNYAQEADGTKHDSKKIICAVKDSDYSDDAHLRVGLCSLPRINGFSTGPYWIVAYDEAKGYALVSGGQPTIPTSNGLCKTGSGVNNSGLWIFTREQQRNEDLLNEVRQIALSKGFDLSVLNDVDQSKC